MRSALFIALFSLSACASAPKNGSGRHSDVAHPGSPTKEISVPFKMHDNRILVDVAINGSGPFTFIFDTGGARSNTMTPEAAKQLGLHTTKGKDATGAGEKAVSYWETKVDYYSIGNLTLRDQQFGVLELSAIKKAFGFPKLDGVIGFDVLERAVTCIDYEKQILTFKNEGPSCFGNGGEVISFKLDANTPVIPGAIDGIPTEFIVDTGDRSAFSVFQKFAAKSGVAKRFDGKPEVVSGLGVGGPIPARLSNLSKLRLGEKTEIQNVLARLPLTKSGYFAKARASLAGSVGNEILRRFNVVFNYPKQEMTLIPNRHFDEPFQFSPPVFE